MRLKTIILIYAVLVTQVSAKDLGVHGATFKIAERSLLDVIHERLQQKRGQLEVLQQEIAAKVKQSALHPTPVTFLKRTQTARTFFYDPTLILDHDIKDAHGKILFKKGTRINPLETLSWGKPLLFLDGEDVEQVSWAQ